MPGARCECSGGAWPQVRLRPHQMALQEDRQWQVFWEHADESDEGQDSARWGNCSGFFDFAHPAP